jgi:hydrogenase expression/formation protein HypC
MCLGIPGQVVEMVPGYGDQLALVDVSGARRRVNIGMLATGPPQPGQWVLIHLGFAVEQVSAEAAEAALQGLELIGRPRETAFPSADPVPLDRLDGTAQP